MKQKPHSWDSVILREAGRCEADFWDGANQRTKDSANRGCREAFDKATQRGINVCVTWRSAECRPFSVPDPHRPTLVKFKCSALVQREGGFGEVVKTFVDCAPHIERLRASQEPASLAQEANKRSRIDSSAGSSYSGPPAQASTTGFQPRASATGFQPQVSSTGYQPQASTAGLRPQVSSTRFQPQVSSTGFQPQASTAGYRPQASTTGFSAGPRYDPNVYANYRPYASTTQPSTASGSSFAYGPKFACLVCDSYGARPTYGTGPPRPESISSFRDLQSGLGKAASYGTYSGSYGSLTIGASRTGEQRPEPPGDDLIAAGGTNRQKKGKAPMEVRPYVCDVCGFSYLSDSSLQAHMKSHTGETYCTICKDNYSSVRNYRRHMESKHPAEFEKQEEERKKEEREKEKEKKKFPCTYEQCSRSFTTASNLKEHIKSHTGETFCPYCFETLGSVAILRSHISKKHKGEANKPSRGKKSS
ncbi:unnamed protein product [Bemisia tabaci]|uniref:C2H2-type domain-containing protein n=1 Tax=Bemisia tabaci TaxID=7038 RepID=A0A9P0APH5_BEMTA|nr:unnamed protein product [Bemisia tabaci]